MRKIILILLLLIIAAKVSFAEDFSGNEKGTLFNTDIIDKINENLSRLEENKDDISSEILKKESNDSEPNDKNKSLSEKIARINSMTDDEQKIKEWANFNSKENYVIINKKKCCATVYDKNSDEIERFEIGVGKEIGDDFNDTSGLLGKSKNTTPAGEYTLVQNIYNKSAYGDLTLSLGTKANKAKISKKVVALHKIPKFRLKDRANKFHDGNLANNRMSHGCINFVEEDFKALTKYIRGGLKTYVLPEEEDNQLILAKNNKGEYEFVQTKY